MRDMVKKYHEQETLADLNSPNSGRCRTARINENRGMVMNKITHSAQKEGIDKLSGKLIFPFFYEKTFRILGHTPTEYRSPSMQLVTNGNL